jgi:hypothetical protein
MSGGSAKREMETGTSHGKAPSKESGAKGREESPPRVKSHRSGDKKKKMKKVVYYETDYSSPSTSGSDAPSVTSKRHEHKKYSKMPLHYSCISKRTPLFSVPLGRPPCFDGEDYSMWSAHSTLAYGTLLSLERRYQKWGTKIMIRTRSPKSGTLTPKQLPYSSPSCVERSIIRCKG